MPEKTSFKCPYCNNNMSLHFSNYVTHFITFDGIRHNVHGYALDASEVSDPGIQLEFFVCPDEKCKRISIRAKGHNDEKLKQVDRMISPPYTCNLYPNFVPDYIRKDYKEACAIRDLSPNASATLSRRCLQGMIRDFWGIKKKSLHAEIDALRGKIDDDTVNALLAFKSIANDGAHPNEDIIENINVIVDVEPDEAINLIKLIELLMNEWYIVRNRRKHLLDDINAAKRERTT